MSGTRAGQSHLHNKCQTFQGVISFCIFSEKSKSLLLLSTALPSVHAHIWLCGRESTSLVRSRSSLPCIAPWQFYCTSFLGHDALRSGCFPSVLVEESGGPSLLQYCIPISNRYRGRYRGEWRQQGDLHCTHPTIKVCGKHRQTRSADWATRGHKPALRWRGRVLFFHWQDNYTRCTVTMLWLSPQDVPFFSFYPTYESKVMILG